MNIKNIILWIIAFILILLHMYVVVIWSRVFNNNPLIPINPAVMQQQRDVVRNYSWALVFVTTMFMVYLVYEVTSVSGAASDTSATKASE